MTDPGASGNEAIEREQQVVGAMLLSPTAIDDVTEQITSSDYCSPRHAVIHDAIVGLSTKGVLVDAVTAADALAKAGDLRRAGGQAYLHQLIHGVATPANAAYYAVLVREDAYRRAVRTAGDRLHMAAAMPDTDPLEVVNAARAELDTLVASTDSALTHEAAVYDAIESLEQSAGIKTPWLPLTSLISGWAPTQCYIFGARPAVGKTVVGLSALLDVARRGQAGLMFSLEMPKRELYLRMLSAVGGVDGTALMHRNLDKADHAKLATAAGKIRDLDIVVDDRSAMSLAQIRAKIRTEQRKRDLGLVIIDYLQIIKPSQGQKDRRVEVDAVAQGIKDLARDCRVPILALAQLNRAIEARAVRVPTLADLREAGGIEQAGDVIVLMHRDLMGAPAELRMVVAKNRHGPMADFTLRFEGRYSQIKEDVWTPTSALGA